LDRSGAIACEVAHAVSRWKEFAEAAGVAPGQASMIADTHRLDLAPVKP